MGGVRGLAGMCLSILRVFLYVFIAASAGITLFGTFCSLYVWWFLASVPWNRLTNPAITVYYNGMLKHADPSNTGGYLVYGSNMAAWITMFGGTLAMALGTIALRGLPPVHRSYSSPVWKAKKWIKRIFLYQLPPRGMWAWWCEGLSPLDLTVWIGTWALIVTWTWQLTQGYWEYIHEAVEGGTFADYYSDVNVHEAKVEAVGNRLGFGACAGFLVLFYLMPRNSFIQHLFHCDFTFLIRYHRWVGHLAMIALSLHGWVYYVAWAIEHRFWVQFRWWQANEISNLAGTISYIFALILWATSFEWVRRNHFEVFYRCHIVGFLGTVLFAVMHYQGCTNYMFQGLTLYLLDLVYRLAQWMNTSAVTGSLVSENLLTLDLRFDPRANVKPQATVWICVPKVFASQYHPFTVSGVLRSTHPSEPIIAKITVKPYGRWAKAVVREIVAHGSTAVRVDGPYGEPKEMLAESDTPMLLVAGGIGVTPILGMLSLIQAERLCVHKGKLPCVQMVWASRNAGDFLLLDPSLVEEARRPDSWLKISLYVTGSGAEKKFRMKDGVPVDRQQAAELAFAQNEALGSSPHGAQHAAYVAKRTSPFFFSPSLLQGYGMGSWEWALAHILSFVGSFFAITVTTAWSVISQFTGNSQYPAYWVFGLISLIAFVVGAMGLPALVIFPLYAWRHLRNSNQQVVKESPASSEESTFKGIDMEAGYTPLPTFDGRPNVPAILKDMSLEYEQAPEISVHSAGPLSMIEDVRRACAECSHARGTYISTHVHTFSL